MRTRALVALLTVAPSVAVAQMTITETADSDNFINIAECNNSKLDGLTFTWNFPGFIPGGTYTLTASDTNGCVATSNNQTVKTTTLGTNINGSAQTGAFPTTGSIGVPTLLSGLGILCNGPATAVFFCVTLSTAPSGTAAVTGSLSLDLATPPAPVLTSADAADSALIIRWTQGSGSTADAGAAGSVDNYKITAVAHDDANDRHTSDAISPGSSTSGRIGGLKNDVLYDVTVTAFSPGGNASAVSDPIQGTPVQVDDFWRIYRNAGGRESGGCAAGAAGMLALLGVPMALRAWRRRRS
jgi:hypothetical protein